MAKKYSIPDGLSLYEFQKSGVDFLVERSRALVASDPGTGKTIQMIVAVNELAKTCIYPLRVLVLCPKSVLINWEREIEKWGAGHIQWTVRNWDKLLREPKLQRTWDIVIGDESHVCIKNGKTKRAQVFTRLIVPRAGRVWLATATPASTSAYDYFETLKLLLPTMFGSWKSQKFKEEFCIAVPDRWAFRGIRYEGFKNTDVLREIFKRCAIRHKKEVVLPQLPEKTYTDLVVEVDPKIVAMNLELETEQVIDALAEGRPLPAHVQEVLQATALAKVSHVLEILSNYPKEESIVVFGWHRTVIEALYTELKEAGYTAGKIDGSVSSNERQLVVDNFQEGNVQIIIANMQSGGVGLTLTKARTAVYIQFPYSPVHLIQSENRVHRIGTSGKVQIIRVHGAGTIDEKVFKVLDQRIKSLEAVNL